MPGRILVIRGGALGDFILTLPAIRLLRENFPRLPSRDPRLSSHCRSLPKADITPIRRVRSTMARLLAFSIPTPLLIPALCDYFAGFQQIISYIYDPDGLFRGRAAAGRREESDFRLAEDRRRRACGLPACPAAGAARREAGRSGCPHLSFSQDLAVAQAMLSGTAQAARGDPSGQWR